MKVLVLGASGLVGSHLVDLMCKDERIETIYCLVRNSLQLEHPKVHELLVDFENLNELPSLKVDILFIAFGTTIKKAETKERQYEIDVKIPSKVMMFAFEMGIKKCALVSALGVSKSSPFFYSRMKADLDENARNIGFEKLIIVKPSVLAGERKEKRVGEKIGIVLGELIGKTGLINAYKPIHARKVAAAMLLASMDREGDYQEIPSGKIELLANGYFDNAWQKKEE
jgi:uncharacterized protein YbjT (DUF2867 family)